MTTRQDVPATNTDDSDVYTLMTSAYGEISLTYLNMGRLAALERLVPHPKDASAEECTRAALRTSILRLGDREFKDQDEKTVLDIDVTEEELRTFARLFLEINDLQDMELINSEDRGHHREPPVAPVDATGNEAEPLDVLARVRGWCEKTIDNIGWWSKIPGVHTSGLSVLPTAIQNTMTRMFEATRGFNSAYQSVHRLQLPGFHTAGMRSTVGAALESMVADRDHCLVVQAKDLAAPKTGMQRILNPTVEATHRVSEAIESLAAERREHNEVLTQRQIKEAEDLERTVMASEGAAASLARIETMYQASLEMTKSLETLVEATRDLMLQQIKMASDAQKLALETSEKNTQEAIDSSEGLTRRQLKWAVVIAAVTWMLTLAVGITQVYFAVQSLKSKPAPVVQIAPDEPMTPASDQVSSSPGGLRP